MTTPVFRPPGDLTE
jgi:hypothetical protein